MCDLATAFTGSIHTLSGWMCNNSVPTSSVCAWSGVSCYFGRVSGISLTNTSIRGTIPNSVGKLQYLTYLGLAHNLLIGTIPSTIGNISSLTYLNLTDNSLHGIIPSSVGSLTRLFYLNLAINLISGALPSSIVRLSLLNLLDISHTFINSTLPALLGSMTKLKALNIDHTAMTGNIPSSICNLTLSAFHISNSLLSCFPSCLNTIASFGFGDVSVCNQGKLFCILVIISDELLLVISPFRLRYV